ncbi:MAG: Hpt domain-containing protein [Pacificimonas sp.]|jgi:HPt (histidine-containing phosphotransfer) domain-containing protein|nr:Hpt domain-containing protein [Pacificimonas sp.]
MTVNVQMFEQIREILGPRLITTLGYFREDGETGVTAIESAQRGGDASGMILPAHTLKTEARQLGAEQLGDLCYRIELAARRCVEIQEGPEDMLVLVAQLRPLFRETLSFFERETNPLQTRRQKRTALGSTGL